MSLHVRVLGELALEVDGTTVEPPVSRRARSLLGLLALEPRPHARSELAARFWPDVLDESARTSLRAALSALRKSLGAAADNCLVATREHVSLGGEVWTDAAAFEELVAAGRPDEAVALYRGDLLSGLDEDWVIVARDEWRERVAGVVGELAAAAEAAGDWAAAIAHTRRVVALDPLGEEGQRALIRRLGRSGDRAAALAAYNRYAERLRTELRIAPSPATRALVEELRGGADEPAPAAVEAPARAAASGTVTLLFTDLVGSTELLGELGDDEAERLRKVHFGLLRDVALSHAGQEVKSLGDGLMVAFGSSLDAAACAVGIQQAVDRHNRQIGSDRLRVRVGLNVGEPIRDEDDYFGTPVVVAKRLCDSAEGGQILASDLVRLLIGDRGGFAFEPVGELALKGLATPVSACELTWAPTGAERLPLPAGLAGERGPLIGREPELDALQSTWRRVRDGSPAVVMVAGEPGIGKTRLVAELCQQAHADGATILLGAAREDALLPYEPFVEALRGYVAVCPPDELGLQAGSRRGVLARLVPELGEVSEGSRGGGDDPGGEGAGERYALLDAVSSLLTGVAATRPAILVLDDLHWADEASLQLLRHVARSVTDVPLLILGTYRATEIGEEGALFAALAELRRARAVEAVSLGGLDPGAVATLIRGKGADVPDALAQTVAERTEGNPFFVEEIVRHLEEAGEETAVPDSVKDLLLRRLRRLGEPARAALVAAAVLGREFDLEALEQMTGTDEDELLEALDEALAAHVLAEVRGQAGRFSFVHELIRETIFDQLSAARLARLHRKAAEALEELYAGRLDERAAELAHHWVRAGDDEKSLAYLLRAAAGARRVHALEAASDHYGAALEAAARLGRSPAEHEPVRRALVERGWLRQVTGDSEAGVADYGRGLEAARAAGDRRLEAEALDSLAFAEKNFDLERSGRHHAEALAIAEEIGDEGLQVRILSRRSLAVATDLALEEAMEMGERAVALADRTGGERDRVLAIDALKLAALLRGDLEQLDTLTTELETVEREAGDLWYLQWTLLESSFVPLAGARWDAALAKLDEAWTINRRIGDIFCGPLIQDARCWLSRSRGSFAQALAAGREAVTMTERTELSPWSSWTRATLAWALLDLRAADEAIPQLTRGLEDAVTLSDRFRAAGHLAWAHAVARDDGAAATAAEEAQRALSAQRVRPGDAYLFGFGAHAALVRTLVAIGRADEGAALATPLAETAARSGWHEAAATLSLALGLCHEAQENGDAARAAYGAAAALAAAHGLAVVEWESQAALARHSEAGEAERLRAASAEVVERIAAGVGDERLAAGFRDAAQG